MPTIEVSEQTFQTLQQMAQAAQKTHADLISSLLPPPPREYTQEELEEADRYVLACTVHAPYAVGSDNESIDADLLRAYADDHNPVAAVEEQAA